MAELDALLSPLSGESPAGPDLAYDEKRQEIEQAFEVGSDDDAGSTDWRQIIKLILDQAEKTRDVWLPIYLARAGAHANRLETVELGSQCLAGLFENFWPTMHPALDELGFQGRNGPCESLARIGEFVGPLKRMTFVEHARLGTFSGEDLERFAKEGDAAEGYGMFRAAMDELAPEEVQSTLDRLAAIRAAIQRVDTVLSASADGDLGTNFNLTYDALDSVRSALAQFGGSSVEGGTDAESIPAILNGGGTNSATSDGSRRGARLGETVETREDVHKALDAIVDYYRRREPGSPVPVAIVRAKSWINMDFLAVLEDISPESVSEARRVLGGRRDDEME